MVVFFLFFEGWFFFGFKGLVEGGAMVSEEHANFIVNTGEATAGDILRLIQRIQEKAFVERGIRLKTEVQIVGVEQARDD